MTATNQRIALGLAIAAAALIALATTNVHEDPQATADIEAESDKTQAATA